MLIYNPNVPFIDIEVFYMSKKDFYAYVDEQDKTQGVELGLFNEQQANGALGKFRISIDLAMQELVNRTYHATSALKEFSDDPRYAKLHEAFFGELDKSFSNTKIDLEAHPKSVDLFATDDKDKLAELERCAEKIITAKNIDEIEITFLDGTPTDEKGINPHGDFVLSFYDHKKARRESIKAEKLSLYNGSEEVDLGRVNNAVIFMYSLDNQTAHDIRIKHGGLKDEKAKNNIVQEVLPAIKLGEDTVFVSQQKTFQVTGKNEQGRATWGKKTQSGLIKNIFPIVMKNIDENGRVIDTKPIKHLQSGNSKIYHGYNNNNDPTVKTYKYPNITPKMDLLCQRMMKNQIVYGTSYQNNLSAENLSRYADFQSVVDELQAQANDLFQNDKEKSITNHPYTAKKDGDGLSKSGWTAKRQHSAFASHLNDSKDTPTIPISASMRNRNEKFAHYFKTNQTALAMMVTSKAISQSSENGLNDEIMSAQVYIGSDKKTVREASPAHTVHQTFAKTSPIGQRKDKVLTVVLTEGISTGSAVATMIEQSNMFDDVVVLSTMDAQNLKKVAKDFSNFDKSKQGQVSYMGYADTQFVIASDNDYKHNPALDEYGQHLSESEKNNIIQNTQKGLEYNVNLPDGQSVQVSPLRHNGAIITNTGYLAGLEARTILQNAGMTAVQIMPKKNVLYQGNVLNQQDVDLVQEYGFVPKTDEDGNINPYAYAKTDFDDLLNIHQTNNIASMIQAVASTGQDIYRLPTEKRHALDVRAYENAIARGALDLHSSIVKANKILGNDFEIADEREIFKLDDKGRLSVEQPFKQERKGLDFEVQDVKEFKFDEYNKPQYAIANGAKLDIGTPNENMMFVLSDFERLEGKYKSNPTVQTLKKLYEGYQLPTLTGLDGKATKQAVLSAKQKAGLTMLDTLKDITDRNLLNTNHKNFLKTFEQRGITPKEQRIELDGAKFIVLDVKKVDKNIYASNIKNTSQANDFLNERELTQKDKLQGSLMQVQAHIGTGNQNEPVQTITLNDDDLSILDGVDAPIFTHNTSLTNQVLQAKGASPSKLNIISLSDHYYDSHNKDYIAWYEKTQDNSKFESVALSFAHDYADDNNKTLFADLTQKEWLNEYVSLASTQNLNGGVASVGHQKLADIRKEQNAIKQSARDVALGEIESLQKAGLASENIKINSGFDNIVNELYDDYVAFTKKNGIDNAILTHAIDSYKQNVFGGKDVEIDNPIEKMGKLTRKDDRLNTSLKQLAKMDVQPQNALDRQHLHFIQSLASVVEQRENYNSANNRISNSIKVMTQQSNDNSFNFVSNVIGASTGRESQIGASLAMRNEDKDIIVPQNNNAFFATVDLSSADAVVGMFITGDKQMFDAYQNGQSIYELAGAQLQGLDKQQQRQLGKLYTLSNQYGQSVMTMADENNANLEDLQKLEKSTHARIKGQGGKTYPEIHDELYQLLADEQKMEVVLDNMIEPKNPPVATFKKIYPNENDKSRFDIEIEYGIDGSKTLFNDVQMQKKRGGYKEFVLESKKTSKKSEKSLHGGTLLNWAIQGTVARAVRNHRIGIHNAFSQDKDLKEVGFVGSLHDDITIVAPADKLKKSIDIMRAQMQDGLGLSENPVFQTKFSVAKDMSFNNDLGNDFENHADYKLAISNIDKENELKEGKTSAIKQEIEQNEQLEQARKSSNNLSMP